MSPVNDSRSRAASGPLGLDPAVVGTACCVASAVGYTAANICLRKLAALGADEMWVTCVKEVVTVSVIGPWLVWQSSRGRRVVPEPRVLVALVLVGLAVQLAGNLSVQWAFGQVGIAVTVPAIFGVMLTAGAVLGLVIIGERLSLRSVAAVGVLIVSIVLLSLGVASRRAPTGVPEALSADLLWVVLGVGAACLGGAMFAVLSTTLRILGGARVPVTSIVFVVTGMGVLSMGVLSAARLGVGRLLATDPETFAWMLAAGTCNLLAFLAITKGLQSTTVVHANVLNASQVAMGAAAGVVLFAESLNAWSVLGIGLTIAGVVLYGRPEEQKRELGTV